MKNLFILVIVLVVLILLYLSYKYIFMQSNIVNNNTDINTITAIDLNCDKLDLEKKKVNELYESARIAFSKYVDSVSSNATLAEKTILNNDWKSKDYYYKNEVIIYNGMPRTGRCANEPLMELKLTNS